MPKHTTPQTGKHMVHKPVVTGRDARGMSPGRTGQYGASLGNHAEHGRTKGDAREAPFTAPPHNAGQRQGNEQTMDTVGALGKGRNVMKSGSQSTHGAVNPGNPPPSRADWWGRS
jgi:hypothetical protein